MRSRYKSRNYQFLGRSKLSKYKIISAITIAILGYFIGIFQDETADLGKPYIKGSARIIDGDSIQIAKQKIRLYGLDAPEMKQPCYKNDKLWKCGISAKERLEEITANKQVFCFKFDDDKYQRAASNCYVEDNNEKINIGKQMVKEGYAVAYRTYSPRFIIDETLAMLQMKGIWGSSFQIPSKWRRAQRYGN